MAYTIGLDYGTNSVRCVIVDIANGSEIGSDVPKYWKVPAGPASGKTLTPFFLASFQSKGTPAPEFQV